jgi:hypothetical protein
VPGLGDQPLWDATGPHDQEDVHRPSLAAPEGRRGIREPSRTCLVPAREWL